jgi:hypothetical protein
LYYKINWLRNNFETGETLSFNVGTMFTKIVLDCLRNKSFMKIIYVYTKMCKMMLYLNRFVWDDTFDHIINKYLL